MIDLGFGASVTLFATLVIIGFVAWRGGEVEELGGVKLKRPLKLKRGAAIVCWVLAVPAGGYAIWDKFVREPEPEFALDLAGIEAVISLGESETINVIRRYKGGAVEDVRDLQCRWNFDPHLPQFESGGKCRIKITALPQHFINGQQDLTINIRVDILKQEQAEVTLVQTLLAKTSFRPMAQPRIVMAMERVQAGQRTEVKVEYSAHGTVPKRPSCRWSPPENFERPGECETLFVAPFDIGPALEIEKDVQVQVTDMPSRWTGSASATVLVIAPPARTALFVLDATERMIRRDRVNNRVPNLDDAKAQIAEAITANAQAGGGIVGGFAFGGPAPSGAVDDCDRISAFYSLKVNQEREALEALANLKAAGNSANIVGAVSLAIQQYHLFRERLAERLDQRFLLVIVTGGPDQCHSGGAASLFTLLRNGLTDDELKSTYYDGSALPLVLKLARADDQEAKELRASPDYISDEEPATIILIPDMQTFIAVTSAVNALASSNDAENKKGCDVLLDLLDQQGDKVGRQKIAAYCSVINQA